MQGGERKQGEGAGCGPDALGPRAVRAAAGLAASVVLYGLLVWSPASLFSFARDAVYRDAGYLASVAFGLALLLEPLAAAFVHLVRARADVGSGAVARRAALACALALAACALLWAAVFAVGSPQAMPALLGVAAAVSGVVLAGAHLWWVGELARTAPSAARRALVLAACLSGLVNLAASLAPQTTVRVLAFALLAANAVLVAGCARPHGAGGEACGARSVPAAAPMPGAPAAGSAPSAACAKAAARTPLDLREAFASFAPIAVAAVVVTLVAPLVNTVLMVDALDPALRIGLGGCMDCAVGVALLALWTLPRRTPSPFAILLGYIALFFVVLLLVWVAGLRAQEVLLALGSAGFFLATYLLADASLDAARSGGPRACASFGVCCGVFMLARVVSDVVSLGLLNADVAEETRTLVTVFLLVYLLTCAAFLLFGALARRRRATVGAEPTGEAAARGDAGFHGPGAASASGMANAPASLDDPDAGGAPLPAASSATAPAPDDVRWEELARRCRRVAAARGLSQREREVLGLMMQGRNVPAIADELVLSRNTVQTHVRHLYERLGVHSRQELVAFVETFDGGARGGEGSSDV